MSNLDFLYDMTMQRICDLQEDAARGRELRRATEEERD
jgi:hypothetical protein